MGADSPGFFSDPKTVIATLALGISVLTAVFTIVVFIFNLANQHEQNRRWDALNIATLDCERVEFAVFREMSLKDFRAVQDWGGYTLTVYPAKDLVRFISYLGPFDVASQKMVPGFSPSYTIAELHADVARLKWPGVILPYRCFAFEVTIKNNGKTDAKDCKYGVKAKWPGHDQWVDIVTETRPIVHASASPVVVSCPFFLPLTEKIPESLDLRVKTEFKTVHGKPAAPREILCRWQSANNTVMYLGEYVEPVSPPR